MGKGIIVVGLVMVAIGVILQFAPWMLTWFGRLPGDIRIENEHSKVFIPITSMILISLAFTLLMNLLRR